MISAAARVPITRIAMIATAIVDKATTCPRVVMVDLLLVGLIT
jgi:hypothetical protein